MSEKFIPAPKNLSTAQGPLQESVHFLERTFALPEDVTAIGDSVMLGAELYMKKLMPGAVVDAGISRQVWEGLSIIKSLDQQGQLGNTVVIELGTNGIFQDSVGQELVDNLGAERTIYWLTVYGKDLTWQEDVNKVIRTLSENNENVHLLDWAEIAPSHPEWFYDDGIHLNLDGQSGFASFIADRVIGPNSQDS